METKQEDYSYNVEEQQYDYLAKEFKLKKSPVYRTSVPGVNGRFYVTFDEENRPILLTSGTTCIADGFADPYKAKMLADWRLSMILKGSNPELHVIRRAHYGTLMHILYGHLLMGKTIPMTESLGRDALEDYIRTLDHGIDETNLQYIFANYKLELKKDILSFLQWVKDYKVKPLAIELMGCYAKYKVGSAIDLVCTLEDEVDGYWGEVYKVNYGDRKKGDPKKSKKKVRVVAIVDYKSGKKGFYDSYILQLYLYRKILEDQYGVKVDATYNFAPNDWRKTPTYKFVQQDDRKLGNQYFDSVMEQGMKKFEDKPKTYSIFTGNAAVDSEHSSVEYQEVNLLEELYKRYCPDKVHELTGVTEIVSQVSNSTPDPEHLEVIQQLATKGEGASILFLSKQSMEVLYFIYEQTFRNKEIVEQELTKAELIEAINQRLFDGKYNMEAQVFTENEEAQMS